MLCAADGDAALHLAAESSEPMALLVTDVVLPNINGKELSQQLLRRYPRMRTLFVSGYTEDTISHHGVLKAGTAFLQKPFPINVLARRTREVLDAPWRIWPHQTAACTIVAGKAHSARCSRPTSA